MCADMRGRWDLWIWLVYLEKVPRFQTQTTQRKPKPQPQPNTHRWLLLYVQALRYQAGSYSTSCACDSLGVGLQFWLTNLGIWALVYLALEQQKQAGEVTSPSGKHRHNSIAQWYSTQWCIKCTNLQGFCLSVSCLPKIPKSVITSFNWISLNFRSDFALLQLRKSGHFRPYKFRLSFTIKLVSKEFTNFDWLVKIKIQIKLKFNLFSKPLFGFLLPPAIGNQSLRLEGVQPSC